MWLLAAAAAAAAAAAGESDAEQQWFHLWFVSVALPLTTTLAKKNVGVGLVDAIVGSRCSCLWKMTAFLEKHYQNFVLNVLKTAALVLGSNSSHCRAAVAAVAVVVAVVAAAAVVAVVAAAAAVDVPVVAAATVVVVVATVVAFHVEYPKAFATIHHFDVFVLPTSFAVVSH